MILSFLHFIVKQMSYEQICSIALDQLTKTFDFQILVFFVSIAFI